MRIPMYMSRVSYFQIRATDTMEAKYMLIRTHHAEIPLARGMKGRNKNQPTPSICLYSRMSRGEYMYSLVYMVH